MTLYFLHTQCVVISALCSSCGVGWLWLVVGGGGWSQLSRPKIQSNRPQAAPVVIGRKWVVVGGGGWLWVVVVAGWLWLVVVGGGWWWLVASVQAEDPIEQTTGSASGDW
jgi:hypothetical protein